MSKDGEVKLIQYLRPTGITRILTADIDKEHAEKAKKLRLSCECMPTGQIMIWGRRHDQTDEEELSEMADNGPGNNTPNDALIRLIDRLVDRDNNKEVQHDNS